MYRNSYNTDPNIEQTTNKVLRNPYFPKIYRKNNFIYKK